MALEIIQTIKQTEEKAEDIKKKALADAKDALKLNDQQNEDYFEQKVTEAKLEAARILSDYESKAADEQQKMKEELQEETRRIQESARKNMDAAVSYIMGRL